MYLRGKNFSPLYFHECMWGSLGTRLEAEGGRGEPETSDMQRTWPFVVASYYLKIKHKCHVSSISRT